MRAFSKTVGDAKALRREMSLPEVLLWGDLRRLALDGLRFRRQHPQGRYVLDFYCARARLAVEIDGAAHDHPGRSAADGVRDAALARAGLRVLRVNARDVLDDRHRPDVLALIAATAAACAPSTVFDGPPPPLRGGGSP